MPYSKSLNLESESSSYEEYLEAPSYRKGQIKAIIEEEEKKEQSRNSQ